MAEQVIDPVQHVDTDAPAQSQPAAAGIGETIARPLDGLWRLLRRPWLLVALALLLLALMMWARFVPQMPGQIADNAAEATRWLNSVDLGMAASFARAVGIYDVLSSPWMLALAAAITLLALVQLADAVGALARWRKLPRIVAAGEPATPVIVAGVALMRERYATTGTVEEVVAAHRSAAVAQHFRVSDVQIDLAASDGPPESTANLATTETRLLLMRRAFSRWLRPLLPLGLLLAAAILWTNALWGWNLRPDDLAPGAQYGSDRHAVTVVNQSPGSDATVPGAAVESEDVPAYFTVDMSNRSLPIPADGAWHALDGVGLLRARGTAQIPGMRVSADEAILSLPSMPTPRDWVGLLFPGPGSEQLVLLPSVGLGLRFVRITDGSDQYYFAEVYDEEAIQPLSRTRIEGEQQIEIPLDDGALTLQITPAAGLHVEIERQLWSWLWLPALLLMLAGLIGLLLPARMGIIQVSPWDVTRSLVIAQGTTRDAVEVVPQATV